VTEHSAISWTTHTWNPWYGCTAVSPGCDHCYAEELMANRYGTVEWGHGKDRVRTTPANWRQPYRWDRQAAASSERTRVFTLSLGDFFDAEVPEDWRRDAWTVIRDTPHLDWLILTKRPNLIARHLPADWRDGYPHVWLGTSVETIAQAWRVDHLRRVPAPIHFLSCEPLLGPLDSLDLTDIQWVISGGESGAYARPMDLAWVRRLRDRCADRGIAFHHKQNGGRTPKATGCLIDGQEYKGFPNPSTHRKGGDR
jgi:protein gp37